MYETLDFNAPTITNFKPEMVVLHRVIRRTLAHRVGDSSRVPQFERNLLKAITEKTKFNAFDFILHEIWNIAISNNCSCAYAPYIMAMIEVVSKHTFVKDVELIPLHPRSSTTPCLPWRLQFLVLLPPPPRMSPTHPPQVARHSSRCSRAYSPFAKAISKSWLRLVSIKKYSLRTSRTSTRRCRLSSASLSFTPLRHLHSFRISLPHSLQPRWSSLAWTLPTRQPLTLGVGMSPPPSLTLTSKLKKETTVMTMRTRTASSSCYYSLFFSLFGVLMPKGDK
jgi:hypothetical protein